MENIQNDFLLNSEVEFDIPTNVLDEIQSNIQNIIENFDIPDENKTEVLYKINQMYSQTKQLTLTDSLTGLYNRRHFDTTLSREFSRAKRYNSQLSLAIIDVDFFKNVNDNYGHSTGDFVLKEIAYKLLNAFRLSDFVFRYGGEEFAIIFPETSLSDAKIPLERLRKCIENTEFKNSKGVIKLTISIGVGEVDEFITNVYDFFDSVDEKLYEAKENGRNKIV
ncbi:MAG: GGDEF domain-containing protein [Candidatus Gastranaerophilales bacterium]